LAATQASADKPAPVTCFTATPGSSTLTPAELVKWAQWQERAFGAPNSPALAVPLGDEIARAAGLAPPTLLGPLPGARWDAPSPTTAGALCVYVVATHHQPVIIPVDTFFQFDQQAVYWSAFAVRPIGGSDWDLTIHDTTAPDPACVGQAVAGSTFASGVDYVVGDYNHNPLGLDYIRAFRFSGTENTLAQWDSGPDAVVVGQPPIHRTVVENDIIEIWDVFLESQVDYTIYFDHLGAGNAALNLSLFRNPASATYYVGRGNDVHTQGPGYGVHLAEATDWYGLAVINENGGAGQYDLAIRSCTDPLQLPYEASPALTAPGEVFFVNAGVGVWAGVGVRGNSNATWSARLYEFGFEGPWPACGGPLVAEDSGTQTRLVLGDFHKNPADTYYPAGVKAIGSPAGAAHIEWDDGRKFLVVDGGAVNRAPAATDVFELWNVSLAAGFPYTIEFATAGTADYRVLLFGNPTGTEYWPVRSQRLLETDQRRTLFTPTFTGAFALVVVNDNGGTGDYSLAILNGTIGVDAGEAPALATRLVGAAPNPTPGSVRVDFELARAERVEMAVMDVAGRTVTEIAARDWPRGKWSERWSGRDAAGRSAPAGVYWVRMSLAGGREVGRQKILVVR